MPWSGRSSRARTESLATIWLTVKCLPTSRRKSTSASGPASRRCRPAAARPRGRRARRSKSRNRASWRADAGQVGRQLLDGEQVALLGLAPRVADHAGGAAGQGDGPVTGQLQAAEVAQLERCRRGGCRRSGRSRCRRSGRRRRGGSSRAGSVIWWTRPRKRRSSTEAATGSACHVATIAAWPARIEGTGPAGPAGGESRGRPTVFPIWIGNYEPVLIERTHDHPLPVTGAVPPALEGRLLRNGPNTVAPAPDGAGAGG